MKYAKWFVGFTVGAILAMLGLLTLGFTPEMPFWRGALGLALIYTSTIIWDKWA